ncbi:MAG: NUDIX domain-containing protein [Magnetococcales bacterium]|nr:NUDIX domain-containing protein [Magnetococcales bacterium]
MIVRPAGIWVVDGQVLTMRYQYSGRDRFNLPGGNQEFGEEIKAGLVREFAEELGVVVEVGDLLWTAETLVAGREVLHLLFKVESMVGSPLLNPDETKALELVWLNPEEVVKVPLYPAIGSCLKPWLKENKKSATYLGCINQDWIA